MPRSFKVRYIPCPVKTCGRQFTNQGGLKNHIQTHRTPQANHTVPQPPVHEDDIPADIGQDAQELDPEYQEHQPAPEGPAKEKITYHPLINGSSFHIFKFTQKLRDSF